LLKHAFGVCEYVVVPEAQDAPLFFGEILVAGFVVLRVLMLPAVDFNNQTRFDTGEVCNEWRNWVLTLAKLACAPGRPVVAGHERQCIRTRFARPHP